MKRFSAPLALAAATLLIGACVNDVPRKQARVKPGFNPPTTVVEEIIETAPRTSEPAPEPVTDHPSPVPPAPVTRVGNPEYGKPVPGKTGFVTSPYAPAAGYVDVRGFPPGTEVKDPYTGKIFLVP